MAPDKNMHVVRHDDRIKDDMKELEDRMRELEDRMRQMEVWQGWVWGAAAATGALIGTAFTAWSVLR